MLTGELANLMRLPIWGLAQCYVRRCGGQLPFRIGVPREIPVKDDFFLVSKLSGRTTWAPSHRSTFRRSYERERLDQRC